MREYLIVGAFNYETSEGVRKVCLDCVLQIDKPVNGIKKVYLLEKDALEIFKGVIDLEKQGLGLFQKVLLVQESYALKQRPQTDDLPF